MGKMEPRPILQLKLLKEDPIKDESCDDFFQRALALGLISDDSFQIYRKPFIKRCLTNSESITLLQQQNFINADKQLKQKRATSKRATSQANMVNKKADLKNVNQ